MIAKLEFNLDEPTDRQEFKRVNKATDAYICLFDISQNIFRPARKHGYSEPEEFMRVDSWSEETVAVVAKLEEMFYQILEEQGISLDDL